MVLGEHYEAAKEFDKKEQLAQHIVDALAYEGTVYYQDGTPYELDNLKKIILDTILKEK